MIVYGIEITDAQLAAAYSAMMGNWTINDITNSLIAAGVPVDIKNNTGWYPIAYRTADRILQQEKNNGRIIFDHKNKYWTWNPNLISE